MGFGQKQSRAVSGSSGSSTAAGMNTAEATMRSAEVGPTEIKASDRRIGKRIGRQTGMREADGTKIASSSKIANLSKKAIATDTVAGMKTGGIARKSTEAETIIIRPMHEHTSIAIIWLMLFCLYCSALINISVNMSSSESDSQLRITAWNMRGFVSSKSYLYNLTMNNDVIVLNEHHLYDCDLHKLDTVNDNFTCFARCSTDLDVFNYGKIPGHCGIAIMWRKCLSNIIRPLPKIGSDRVCAIEVCAPKAEKLYIIGVYLPHRNSKIGCFETEVSVIEQVIMSEAVNGHCVVIGDWNCQFEETYGDRCCGSGSINAEVAKLFVNR